MKPLLTREQSRRVDTIAIEKLKLQSLVLMENAGRGATDILARELCGGELARKCIVVVCGTGNNGGDGFVVARHALVRGADARVWLVGEKAKFSPDARTNHDAFVALGGHVESGDTESLTHELAACDAIVDAILGTGLSRTLDESALEVARAMSLAPAPVLALDVPSGMNADTGDGPCVHATATVTFHAFKLGLATGRGAEAAGTVYVADIGVPASLLDAVDDPVAVFVDEAYVRRAVSADHGVNVHKHDKGHVLIVGGAPGHAGAPVLAAHAALRAGAGLATLATWSESVPIASGYARAEVMVAALGDQGGFDEGALDELLEKKSACLVGPGLGHDPRARRMVERVLAQKEASVILDADAITMFAGEAARLKALIKASDADVVITPHAGELGRLLGTSSSDIESDRFAAVQRAAEETGATVLLKGPYTLVASPREPAVLVGRRGASLLAVAGAGDCLGGIIAALVRTAGGVTEAAAAGAWVHARAAEDLAADGARGLYAGEIADRVPRVLSELTPAPRKA